MSADPVSVARFAANTNAETIREMRIVHQQERIDWQREKAQLIRENKAMNSLLREFQEAVIEHEGERMTLMTVRDRGLFDALCLVCRDVDCAGVCPKSDPADYAEGSER